MSISPPRSAAPPSAERRPAAPPPADGLPPFDAAYAAIHARDTRFDGHFYTAVSSTGIYCRPSCPAPTPKPQNVRFVRTPAEAQSLGYRPCLRCFPEALPDTADAFPGAALAQRALARIGQGALDDAGVPDLAAELATSTATLGRALREHTGVGAVAHARAHRARTAFRLLASTELPVSDVAFASGFGSVRTFNEAVQQIFGRTPVQLRAAARRSPLATGAGTPARLSARLGARGTVDVPGLLGFFAPRTLPGVDRVADGRYTVAVRLAHGAGTLSLGGDGAGRVRLGLVLDDAADLTGAVATARGLFDLDSDSPHIDAALSRLPWLAASVAARPGARIPGEPTLTESLLRAVATQQVSAASGRAQLVRLVAAVTGAHADAAVTGAHADAAAPGPGRGVWHDGDARQDRSARQHRGVGQADDVVPAGALAPFPTAEDALARLPEWFRGPAARRSTLEALLTLLAAEGDPADAAERSALLERVGELKGIGPWTLAYTRLRTLGDPDVDLSGDGALLTRARGLGLAATRRELADLLETARPWRSYAALHLWEASPTPSSPPERSTPCSTS